MTAESVADENAHDHDVLDSRNHRVRGNLPASRAQPLRNIKQRVPDLRSFAEGPGHCGDTAATVSVEEQVEWSGGRDLFRKILRGFVARSVDHSISFAAQTQHEIILAYDLSAGPREI